MAAVYGLEIKVDGTNIVKLTNRFTYYRRFSKVTDTVVSSPWVQVRETFYGRSFTVNDLPSGYRTILAIRTNAGKCWLRKTGETSTSVTFYAIAELGADITVFVWTTAPPPRNPSKSGLEIRNPATGQMIFCSETPVIKVLGSYNTTDGYVGRSTIGKTCAVVPMKEWINEGSVDDFPFSPNCPLLGGSVNNGWTGQIETYEYRSVVDTNTNPPTHSLRSYYQSVFVPCQSNPSLADGVTVSMSASFLVIDVTGL